MDTPLSGLQRQQLINDVSGQPFDLLMDDETKKREEAEINKYLEEAVEALKIC
ncbi:hypothetical protein L1N85_23060 [Paenibacillus alkaliterrae]|uniref:hypothetical protein n=1 Tax=Paenibacillus alkaliterrae TaxID=320909 RepID=UPI001F19285F|nr:hypothetical protein [Paenibacillus alkaliterrae]MCF2941251.1 hypothetical protein [Paenibacillus alkaliterrae]